MPLGICLVWWWIWQNHGGIVKLQSVALKKLWFCQSHHQSKHAHIEGVLGMYIHSINGKLESVPMSCLSTWPTYSRLDRLNDMIFTLLEKETSTRSNFFNISSILMQNDASISIMSYWWILQNNGLWYTTITTTREFFQAWSRKFDFADTWLTNSYPHYHIFSSLITY